MTRTFLVRTLAAVRHWAGPILPEARWRRLQSRLPAPLATAQGHAILLAGLLVGAVVVFPILFSGSSPSSAQEFQGQLDLLWGESDWIGVIAWLEPLQNQGLLAPHQKDALYAAYVSEAKPLAEKRRFKDARSFLERAIRLSPHRPEAKDLLETRERELREFLHDTYGGASLDPPAASWYGYIQEIVVSGEEATARTGLQSKASNKPIARAICAAVLGYQPAALEAVTVSGVDGWTAARCP